MATKKQQQLKKKQRDFKKKKAAQAKLAAAREADPEELEERRKVGTRNQFGAKHQPSQSTAQGGGRMHRPQGG